MGLPHQTLHIEKNVVIRGCGNGTMANGGLVFFNFTFSHVFFVLIHLKCSMSYSFFLLYTFLIG